MGIRDVLNDDTSHHQKKEVLSLDGQVVEVLTDLPPGFEYKLHRLSNAVNSKIILLVVKTNA